MDKNRILIAETIENQISPSYKELLGFGASFHPDRESRILLIIPGQNVKELAEQIAMENNIHTLAIEHEDLRYPNPCFLEKILPEVIRENMPSYICLMHNVRTCQLAASLSIQIGTPCITGIESYEIQQEKTVFTRMMFNGKLIGRTACKTGPVILTVIPGSFSGSFTTDHSIQNGKTMIMKVHETVFGYKPVRIIETISKDNKLEEADVIVSAGMGIEKEERMELIRKIASIFSNAAIGGSRIVCDHGWLPYSCQIGETGKQVSPKLYIACGISGTMQHTAGMKKSGCIVAINKDPNAPIFSIADYGVVEYLQSFLPILAARYDDRKKNP